MDREELLKKGNHVIKLINEDVNSFILQFDPGTHGYHLLYKYGNKPVKIVESVVVKHLEIHKRLARSKRSYDTFVSPNHRDASIDS